MAARSRESRKSARRWVRHGANIILDTQAQVRCILHDISDGGARLSLPGLTSALPDTFTLALYDGSVRRECELVWTEGKYIGVRFTSKWHSTVRAEHPDHAVVDVIARPCEADAEQKRHEH